MAQTYVEHESYGPLRFGMSPDEAASVAPDPDKDALMSDLIGHHVNPALHGPDRLAQLGEERLWQYSDSNRTNDHPELVFINDMLAEIRLRHKADRLEVRGIDVFAKDRRATIVQLASFDETVYISTGEYIFPSTGLKITGPRTWRSEGAVSLISRDWLTRHLRIKRKVYDFPGSEITGKE